MKKPLAIALILVILFMPFIVYGINNKGISNNTSDTSSGDAGNYNSLTGVQWQLTSAIEGDMLLMPDNFDKFVLTFNSDGTYFNTTDCNSISGAYTLTGNDGIAFEQGASTMMYCDGSQESAYSSTLYKTNRYVLENNQLTLYSPDNLGQLVYTNAN